MTTTQDSSESTSDLISRAEFEAFKTLVNETLDYFVQR
jgi:hypothetical protein